DQVREACLARRVFTRPDFVPHVDLDELGRRVGQDHEAQAVLLEAAALLGLVESKLRIRGAAGHHEHGGERCRHDPDHRHARDLCQIASECKHLLGDRPTHRKCPGAPRQHLAATPLTSQSVWGDFPPTSWDKLRAMSKDRDKAFFGHPAGLSTLFFTEMWERLSYYGARAFLFIFMTTAVTQGGLGMTDASAGLVMA